MKLSHRLLLTSTFAIIALTAFPIITIVRIT